MSLQRQKNLSAAGAGAPPRPSGPSFYEQLELQQFEAAALRPGGLQTTRFGLRLAALPTGCRVLDVGCGGGAAVAYLQQKGLSAIGVDCAAALLAAGRRQHPGLPLRQGRAERLPFGGRCFDAALLECTLSVLEQPRQALREIRRVLRPGGKLLLSDLYLRGGAAPQPQGLPGFTQPGGLQTKKELCALLGQNGFRFVGWQDCASLYRGFLAASVMAYGSMADFWRAMGQDCRAVGQMLPGQKLSYFVSIWQKPARLKKKV